MTYLIKTTLNKLPKKYNVKNGFNLGTMFYRNEEQFFNGTKYYNCNHYNKGDNTYSVNSFNSLGNDKEIFLNGDTIVYYEPLTKEQIKENEMITKEIAENEIESFIDNEKTKAFKNAGSFPNGKLIPHGYHSGTIINEVVNKFNIGTDKARKIVLKHLMTN